MKAYKTIPLPMFYEGSEYRGVPDVGQICAYSPRAIHPMSYGRPVDKEVFRKARKSLIDKGYISYRIDRVSLTGKTYSNYKIHKDKILKASELRMKSLDESGMFSCATAYVGSRSVSLMADTRRDIKQYDVLIRSHALYLGVSYTLVATHSILRALCAYIGSVSVTKLVQILIALTKGVRSVRSIYDSVKAMIRGGMCTQVQNVARLDIFWGLNEADSIPAITLGRRYYGA